MPVYPAVHPNEFSRKQQARPSSYSTYFYFIFSAKELSDVDIIAIAVSLGLTAFLVVFVGYFVWRARNNPPINKSNNIAGHVST